MAEGSAKENPHDALPEVLAGRYCGVVLVRAIRYSTVPTLLAAVIDRHQFSLPFWRIELEGIAPAVGPLGCDLYSDAVIGRDPSVGEIVDIDLGPYNALERGVSRRHALLHPTRNGLYVMDLDTGGGTRVNNLLIEKGGSMEVRSGDTITLGKLHFTVKILLSPAQTSLDTDDPMQDFPDPESLRKLAEEY